VSAYLVTFAASAKRELRDLPADVIERVVRRIRELAAEPRPAGCKKLQGLKSRWRIRVGNYRIVYAVDDAGRVVDIIRIAHRKEVYD
jgi:mRNA interferase RelE/StbE